MGKSSEKKRRRREKLERQRRELERSRQISLMDQVASPEISLASPAGTSVLQSKHRKHPHDQGCHQTKDSATKSSMERACLDKKLFSETSKEPGSGGKSSDIGSRKRSRREIEFVYPKDKGVALKFSFRRKGKDSPDSPEGQKLSEDPSSSSTSNEKTSERKNVGVTESIDDILYPSKRKKGKDSTADSNNKAKTELLLKGRKEKRDTYEEKKNHQSAADVESNVIPDHGMEGKLSALSVEEVIRDRAGCRPRANSTDGELNLPRRGLCDERMVLQTHNWDLAGHSVFRSSPKGLANLGNTCFLNSTLQCLAYLPPFCQSLLAMPDHLGGNGKKISQGKRITMILRSLFHKVHSKDKQYSGGAVAPHSIVKALPSLGTCGSRNGYKFRPGRQEDAHEFLVHLLDAMHDGELRESGELRRMDVVAI
jgi:hypothetical protein